jgi:hypothetical protein
LILPSHLGVQYFILVLLQFSLSFEVWRRFTIRKSNLLLLDEYGLKRILLEQSHNVLHEKITTFKNKLVYMAIKIEIKIMKNSLVEKENKEE